MRELILKMSISIDGFVSDLEGRNAWMFGSDEEAKAWSVETIAQAGLHIMGSRTFETMAAHWPSATDMFAPPMNRIPKAVFSRRGAAILPDFGPTTVAGTKSWAEAYVASGDLAEEVAALKAQGGGPIMAHGGAAFARSLLAGGLIDRMVLLVHPVALGRGLPLFSELAAPMPLELVGSKAFPGGAVAQTYRRASRLPQ